MLLWCILPLPPPVTHLSSMVPLPPAVLPNHDAVGRALLREDNTYGVAHSHVVWVQAGTGAALYVGSSAAALDMAFLRRRKILRVVNCTGNIPNFYEGQSDLLYYRFNVSRYRSRLDEHTTDDFMDMLHFVTDGLRGATAVLVHCRAGRHLAGAVAHACVVWIGAKTMQEANEHLRRHRPQIELTHDFLPLMAYLESRLGQ